MDLSPLRKWEILGPDAEELLQATMTRDIRRLADGQVVYTALCNDTGGMIDDGTVFRLGQDNFRFVGGAEYDGVWLREQADRLGLRVWVKDSTDELHNVAVQGPDSRDLLAPLIWTAPTQTPFAELKWFRFSVARIGGAQGMPLVVSRTGLHGRARLRALLPPEGRDDRVGRRVGRGRRPHGLAPLGLEALDMLRIEAGLVFAGYEFDDQVDPFEAGIGFTVPVGTDDDFVGKEALAERRAHPQRVLVGLELEGNEPAAHGDCVHVGRQQVGVITSGTRSPVLKKNIALCRMNVRTPSSARRSRSASSTASRSAFPRRSSASRSTTRRRCGRARERAMPVTLTDEQVDGVRPRRVPDRRGRVPRPTTRCQRLRERFLRLFDGEYETGIKPDEVNWVPGRDPRTGRARSATAGGPTP